MTKKCCQPSEPAPRLWYRGKDVPMRVIRRFARDVTEKFHPDRIILEKWCQFSFRRLPAGEKRTDTIFPARSNRTHLDRTCLIS
jgi:hypothetical protein